MSARGEAEAGSAAAGPAAEGRRLGWEARLVRASPLGLFWTGAIIAALIYTSFVGCALWNGVTFIVERDGVPTLAPDVWTAVCMSLLWWSILSLGEYTRRTNLAEAHALIGLGVTVNVRRLRTLEHGPLPRQTVLARLSGLFGGIAGIFFYTKVYQPNGHPVQFHDITLTSIWFLTMTASLFAEIFSSLAFVRSETASLVRDLDHRVPIDLLDISKLDGFGRIALRGALPWLVTGTIVLLLLLGQQSTEYYWPLIGGLAVSATIIFAMPMWRVHRLIDTAKHVELARLHGEIDAARRAFERRDAESDSAGIRLAALLALEGRIEHAREWPLDLPTVTRFLFYLALPLGSWLGGAIVERALDIVLH